MSDRATVAKLRELATEATARGRYDQALKCFLELERVDPDPDWSRRAAAAYKRLNRPKDEVDALLRATREYTKRGEIMKAVATSKQILAIEPRHKETLRLLPSLRAAFDSKAPALSADGEMEIERTSDRTSSGSNLGATSDRLGDAAAALRAEMIGGVIPMPPPPPRQALVALPLRDVVPGAAPAARATPSAGIYQIPLKDEVGEEVELELKFDEPLHLSSAREGNLSIDIEGNVQSEAAEDLAIAAVEEEFRAAEKANQALQKTPIFAALTPKAFRELLMTARLVELEDKNELFKQGTFGDALYVIAEGKVGVVDEGPPRRGIATLTGGDYFGEIALVTDQPRTATIVALEDSLLIAIDREVIHKVIAKEKTFLTTLLRMLRDRLVDRLLSTNPLFTSLSERDRTALKPRFRFLELEPGAMVLAEGRRPEGLLIFLAGKADVYRVEGGREVIVGELNIGDVCGETALLTDSTSLANVRTKTKSLAIELPAAAFTKIVGARPEALAFIKQVMEQRVAKSKAVLSGKASYAEGHLRVV